MSPYEPLPIFLIIVYFYYKTLSFLTTNILCDNGIKLFLITFNLFYLSYYLF